MVQFGWWDERRVRGERNWKKRKEKVLSTSLEKRRLPEVACQRIRELGPTMGFLPEITRNTGHQRQELNDRLPILQFFSV